MSDTTGDTPSSRAVQLALDFLNRAWGPSHDLGAINELMTEDYEITSGGAVVSGRRAFTEWVARFQDLLHDARTTNVEAFANEQGTIVVSRWVCTGNNNGIFGLPANGKPISFTGIAIWHVRAGRLSKCWVERSALEAVRGMTAT